MGIRNATKDIVTCDVLVIGSGAGGLSAALTARWHGLDVLVVEKESTFGGTTTRSGGAVWIPNNSLAARQGARDSLEAARTYIKHAAGNHFDPVLVEAFLLNGPRMVDAFQERKAVEFCLDVNSPFSFSDYYLDVEGSVAKGRSLRIAAFDGRALGDALGKISPPLRETTFLGMGVERTEVSHFFNATRSMRSALRVAYRLLGYACDLLVYGHGTRLVNGNALIAGLAKSAFDLGISLWLSSPAQELIVDTGAVRGAMVLKDQRQVPVTARKGVVLACGGFPRDPARREVVDIQRRTGQEFPSNSRAGNTGDGLRLAEAVGARVSDGYPNNFYWTVVSRLPYPDESVGYVPHSNGADRCKPGVIAVTHRGRRFVNECSVRTARALVREAEAEHPFAAFLVCDHRALRRYGLGGARPFPLPISPHLRSGYLVRGTTIRELAERAGIDPDGLESTVRQYNKDAREGVDRQFNRGSNDFDRRQGDKYHKPNPCVGPLEQAPFYAVKILPAIIGTYAGLKTDENARVIATDGKPIPGLYAVGNDMASLMGGEDPGAGSTLGPAMTFGYIAGNHLAGR